MIPRCFMWTHWVDEKAENIGGKSRGRGENDKSNLEYTEFGNPVEYPSIDYQ